MEIVTLNKALAVLLAEPEDGKSRINRPDTKQIDPDGAVVIKQVPNGSSLDVQAGQLRLLIVINRSQATVRQPGQRDHNPHPGELLILDPNEQCTLESRNGPFGVIMVPLPKPAVG